MKSAKLNRFLSSIFSLLALAYVPHYYFQSVDAALHPTRLPQWQSSRSSSSGRHDDVRSMCADGRAVKLPIVRAHGTFYDIGRQTGQQMKAQLLEFYGQYTDLNNVYLPFYSTQEGVQLYNNYLNITKNFCPDELDQLRGLGDGAGIEFHKLFLLNINPEIDLYMEQTNHSLLLHRMSKSKGDINQDCTTILINRGAKADFAIVHNDDNDGEFSPFSYVLNAVVKLDAKTNVNFTAFSYPGMLAGNAFGFNQHGVVLTSNALSPKGLPFTAGIPRYFFNHMLLLRSKSVDDAIHLIQSAPVASGFSLNIADIKSGNMANIEIAQQTAKGPKNGSSNTIINLYDIAYVGNRTDSTEERDGDVVDRLYHFNKYDRLPVAQIAANIMSSQHREARANALSPANTINDAMSILGDTADLDFPIYRTPSSSATSASNDQGCTLATAAFDLRARKFSIYRSNPRNVTESEALHFDLP